MSSLVSTTTPSNVPTSCRVAVGKTYLYPTWRVSKVELQQETKAHEFARITTTVPPRSLIWPSGTPVSIEYGQPNYSMDTFYGYLNHIEYLDSKTAELWCVGASFPLKNEALKMWNQVSPSFIARTIAAKYSLSCDVDIYDGLITQMQSGESDLEFLSRVSDLIGFRFFVHATKLYFINPLLPIRNITTSVPTFWADPNNFKPRFGELVPGQGQITKLTGYALDSTTGKVLTMQAQYDEFLAFGSSKNWNPIVQKYHTTSVSGSLDELRRTLNAEVSRNLNWITANDVLLGNGSANVTPYSVVNIQGDIDKSFSGYWLVDAIAKTLTPSGTGWTYNANATLIRDQTYGLTSQPSLNQAKASIVNGTLLRNGTWVSNRVGL